MTGRIEGTVTLDIVIDRNGNVTDVKVIDSVPLLDEAAVEAARQWRYETPLVDGEPRTIITTATVDFRLQ